MSRVVLEVCLTSVDDAVAAARAGADRIELNSALSLDGLTPTPGMLRAVRQAVTVPIITLIRPRTGFFVSSESDFRVMLDDAEWALAEGSAGLVLGFLTEDRKIDIGPCRQLRELIGDRQAVFHRAFDAVDDQFTALEQLIDLGFTRILTSGGKQSAREGSERIRQFIDDARGRIEVLPAGGINSTNVADLVRQTGCRQVHGSFRQGGAGDSPLDARVVAEVRKKIDNLGPRAVRFQ